MRITAYLDILFDTLENCPYLESRELYLDERSPDAGYIKGTITFVDGSTLIIKEFVIFKESSASIVKYGYHYVNSRRELIFRYDNAFDPAARLLVTWPEHKHTPNGLFPRNRPPYVDLLAEISDIIAQVET
jgi:hypothetical protein